MLISRKISLFAASADPYLGKFGPECLDLCPVVVLVGLATCEISYYEKETVVIQELSWTLEMFSSTTSLYTFPLRFIRRIDLQPLDTEINVLIELV